MYYIICYISVCYDVNTHAYNNLHSRVLIDNFVSKCNIISKALDSVNNNVLSLYIREYYKMSVLPKK